MPTAILRFNLDEPDDRAAHFRAIKSMDLLSALEEIQSICRSLRDNPPEGCTSEAIDSICDRISEPFLEYNIDPTELSRSF
jgi:hypothetical protein